jgi:hypothetical protein
LQVSGQQHPFLQYRQFGVSVALVTDDEVGFSLKPRLPGEPSGLR